MKGYPRWFSPFLLSVLLAMLVTGLLLAPTTLVMRFDLALPWRLPGAGRILTAALHAGAGFIAAMLMGALWSVHMRAGWRRRRQRVSGALCGALLLVLALSAVGVYYLGEEISGTVAATTHLAAGVLLVLPFGWHWWRGRRRDGAGVSLHAVGSEHAAPARRQAQG